MRTTLVCRTLMMWLLFGAVSLPSCSSKDSPAEPGPSKQSKDSVRGASRVIFRDAKGRELREADLAGFTGQVQWELVGGGNIPERAKKHHRQGREAGGKEDYDRALALFARAHKEAPKWPYPVYDAAFTYLLKGDAEKAEEFYALVDKLAPRGFFTAKTALDCLRREKAGDLKPGTYKP